MQDFEKLPSFYLGRAQSGAAGEGSERLLLYDAKDLTTHALCVGMTGSGKTGLCIGLLEEAALDGIPSIVIDPKGDMGNLLLAFPELAPEDFEPWIDPGEAARKGQDVAAYAASVAQAWRQGLADWGQDGERIARLRASADFAIYTPGSQNGLPLCVLRSFDAPAAGVRADPELFGDRVQAAASGLLALIGLDADPVQSRDYILVSNLLQHAWNAGKNLSLEDLIREIQAPPFERLGVLDLESIYPSKERFGLALRLNNLLASPGFANWLAGEPLDVERLLHTREGRPRVSILSIAHLSEAERMFFVAILLNEVVAWMRAQPGTSSLRAILYMDEIQGYFPPTKEPPSKKPMLTLLKQARAYGLGVVLATQNPVDLDYKGLGNTGTWFLGRLQTERDKQRVLDGLEGAMANGGKTFDRAALDRLLSSLGKRTFLMNNVHEDGPVVFQTRWALCYLRGPLTREHVRALMGERVRAEAQAARPAEAARTAPAPVLPAAAPAEPARASDPRGSRGLVPDGIQERFLAPSRALAAGETWLYEPCLFVASRLHYASARAEVDHWVGLATWAALGAGGALDWDEARHVATEAAPEFAKEAQDGARFAEPPAEAFRKKSYASWQADLKRWLYEKRALELLQCKDLKLVSRPGESEGAFRVRVAQAAREAHDRDVDLLRRRWAAKLAAAQSKVLKARSKIEREAEQVSQKQKDTLISTGTALFGALFGRKLGSAGNVTRAGSTLRSAGRIGKERADVERAEVELASAQAELAELERALAGEIAALGERWRPADLELAQVVVRPKKTDLAVAQPVLAWLPAAVGADGLARLAHELG